MGGLRGKNTGRIREHLFSGCFLAFALMLPAFVLIYLIFMSDLVKGIEDLMR